MIVDYIQGGATLWARQTIESEIFFYKPDKWFKIWFYIVNTVNHRDNKLFPRGSGLITYADIVHDTKATKNQIDMFMRWAKKRQMLTTQKTTRGMIVTILNYNKFQDLKNYKTDTQTELQPKRNRNGNDTINKNERMKENNKGSLTLPDWLDPNLWKDFKDHRKKLRKPMTQRAEEMVIKKIEYLKSEGFNPKHLIVTAIERGWLTIFDPRGER